MRISRKQSSQGLLDPVKIFVLRRRRRPSCRSLWSSSVGHSTRRDLLHDNRVSKTGA